MNTLWFWCLRLPVCLVHRIASLKFPRGLRTSHRTLCGALWMFPFIVVETLKSLCNVIQCMCTVLVLVFFLNTFLHQLSSQNKPGGSVNYIIHCSRIVFTFIRTEINIYTVWRKTVNRGDVK